MRIDVLRGTLPPPHLFLQVPRGAFLSMSHDPGSTPSVPECVEVVRLVVVVEQRDGLGRRAVAASDGGKLRDFKRFRKVHVSAV